MQLGHNSVAAEQLRSIIERVENLAEKKKAIAQDIGDVFAEAKGNGFHVKTIRTILRVRAMAPDERVEQEAILDTYLHALGMVVVTENEDGNRE